MERPWATKVLVTIALLVNMALGTGLQELTEIKKTCLEVGDKVDLLPRATQRHLTRYGVDNLRLLFWEALGADFDQMMVHSPKIASVSFHSALLADTLGSSPQMTLILKKEGGRLSPMALSVIVDTGNPRAFKNGHPNPSRVRTLLIPTGPLFQETEQDSDRHQYLWKEVYRGDGVLSAFAADFRVDLSLKDLIRWEDVYQAENYWGEPHKFVVFRGVATPNNPYTLPLIRAAGHFARDSDSNLVLGAGSGPDSVVLASVYNAEVDAVDVSEGGVVSTKINAALFGVGHRVHVWQSDLFSNVRKQYKRIYDVAPLPVNRRPPEVHNAGYSYGAYDEGGVTMKRLMKDLPKSLLPGGSLYVMSDPNIRSFHPRSFRVKTLSSFYFEAIVFGFPVREDYAIHEVQIP